MTLAELDRAIQPNMRGAYLFFGDEDYLKGRYREKMRASLLADETLAPFNHSLISDLSLLSGEIETLPMLAERRLVEVSDVNLIKLNKDALDELAAMLKDTGDTVVLFYMREEEFAAGTAKKPTELYKKLSEAVQIVEFAKQASNKLASWAGKHFAASGVFAPPEVCHALIERSGTDMNVLSCEIDKLSAYALAKGQDHVTAEMLPSVVTSYRESGAFDFVNAIMEGDMTRAFALFTDMKRRREKPIEIASSIFRVISDMLVVKTLTEAGMSLSEIVAATKMKEYSVKLRQNSVRNRSVKELERAAELCYETDVKLKSRSVDKYFLIERLIIALSR